MPAHTPYAPSGTEHGSSGEARRRKSSRAVLGGQSHVSPGAPGVVEELVAISVVVSAMAAAAVGQSRAGPQASTAAVCSQLCGGRVDCRGQRRRRPPTLEQCASTVRCALRCWCRSRPPSQGPAGIKSGARNLADRGAWAASDFAAAAPLLPRLHTHVDSYVARDQVATGWRKKTAAVPPCSGAGRAGPQAERAAPAGRENRLTHASPTRVDCASAQRQSLIIRIDIRAPAEVTTE